MYIKPDLFIIEANTSFVCETICKKTDNSNNNKFFFKCWGYSQA